jgi:filamentous hemagglutinin family protein
MNIGMLKICLPGVLFLGYLFASFPVQAQITSDETLPIPTRVIQSGGQFEIIGGTEAGNNLFHSFKDFSVRENDVAQFLNNNASIQNVIGRITGTSVSEISGNIMSGGNSPNFNLFIVNPNGIIFGPKASLNLGGSFIATTSNAIQFGEQGLFNLSITNDPSLLSIDPTAFIFNQVRPQSIIYQSALEVPSGNSFLLLGGNLELDGGSLKAPNGRVELGSLAEPGIVRLNMNGRILSLNFPNDVTRGDVSLTKGSSVDVIDKGSGSISITAQNIEFSEGSLLQSGISPEVVSDTFTSGAITLNAAQSLTLKDGSGFFSVSDFSSVGDSGDISVVANSLLMESLSGIATISLGSGNAGDIKLKIRDGITLSGSNDAGSSTLIGSVVLPSGEGKSGNIKIQASSLSLSDGSIIRTNIFGKGNSGDIIIHVDDFVLINDSGNNESTQIRTAVEPGAIGDGGKIDISARSLSLSGGGQLTSAVLGPSRNSLGGQGKGGDISVSATDSVTISGLGLNGFESGIFANSEAGGNGAAGNVEINTNLLKISDEAQIKLSNPQGQAGNLKINANFIILNDGTIAAETGGLSASNSANINLTTSDLLRIENQSLISAKASGSANGGNIKIDTLILLALPPNGFNGSDILANAEFGKGGNIIVNAQGVFGIEERKAIDGNQSNDIDASSQFGRSGQVQINTANDPNKALVELPVTVVDPNALVAQNPCKRGSESEFTRSGRGGLPPSLSQDFDSDATQVGLVAPVQTSTADRQQTKASESKTSSLASVPSPIVPAQGWVFNDKGEVVLVADNSAIAGSQRLKANPAGCPVR